MSRADNDLVTTTGCASLLVSRPFLEVRPTALAPFHTTDTNASARHNIYLNGGEDEPSRTPSHRRGRLCGQRRQLGRREDVIGNWVSEAWGFVGTDTQLYAGVAVGLVGFVVWSAWRKVRRREP